VNRDRRRAGLVGAGLTVLIGAAVAAGVGGFTGLVAGVIAGPALGVPAARWWSRRSGVGPATEARAVAAELPYAADLLAAALRAGAPPDVAVRCVALALGGPVGHRLGRVAYALGLGATATEAWSYLGDVPGGDRIRRAAVRSQHSGAAFAGALLRVADDLRADRLVAAEAAARRAGVLIVLPLGLCFLPAFVLAGLVPVMVAVLGDVLTP
jgi:pilus assembly protein TadC